MALPAGFAQTLLSKLGAWSLVQQGTNAAMDCVNTDINMEEYGTVGTTVNVPVNVPVQSQVVNQAGIAYSAPVYNTYAFNVVPVTLTNLIGYSYAFPSLDQISSPLQIQKALVDPALKAVENSADATIINTCFNSTSFGINPVVSTTGSLVTPQQLVQGGKLALTMQNLDTDDQSEMVFLQHPAVYMSTLFNPNWAQNFQVGETVANNARVLGVNRVAFGAAMAQDQQMPASGSAGSQTYTSIYMKRDCIAAAYRKVPLGEGDLLVSEYIMYKGLPLAVELSYLGQTKMYYYNVQIAMGVKVVRPDWGVIFSTAQ